MGMTMDIQMFYAHRFEDGLAHGDEYEIRHLSKVLRKKVGDLAYFTQGDGSLWQGEILSLSRSSVIFKPLKLIKQQKEGSRIAVAVAPTKKSSRLEDLVEKCTQLGLTDLYLIRTERTLRKEVKVKRLEQLTISAMKQCLRLHKLRIHEMKPYKDFLASPVAQYSRKYIGKIEGTNPWLINGDSDDDVIVLIGPEGDFTEKEYDMAQSAGFEPVKLSEYRLRTEMAGITAVAAIQNNRELTNS